MAKKKPSSPSIRWVMHPSDRGTLVHLGDGCEEQKVPEEDQVITRPFLVDASSLRPIAVRVVQRLEWHHSNEPTFVVVVTRSV